MKVARFFAVIFAVIGVVIMLVSAVICFASIDSSVKILENPTGAVQCSDELMNAVNGGDFPALEQLIYGQPELEADGAPAGNYAQTVWEYYADSMSFAYTSKLYLLDADLARDGSVTTLDLERLSECVASRAKILLEAKVASATDMKELYAEDGAFRPELVAQVMQEALQSALSEDIRTVTQDVTVRLIYRDGQWWAVPDQRFLKAISGIGG